MRQWFINELSCFLRIKNPKGGGSPSIRFSCQGSGLGIQLRRSRLGRFKRHGPLFLAADLPRDPELPRVTAADSSRLAGPVMRVRRPSNLRLMLG